MPLKRTWLVLLLFIVNHVVLGQINQYMGCTLGYDDCACNNCILPADAKYRPSSASSPDFECTCQSYDLIFAIYTCLQTANCNKPLSEYMQDILSVCNIDSGYNVAPVISSVEAAVAATMTFGTETTTMNKPAAPTTVTTIYTSGNNTYTSTFVTSTSISVLEDGNDNNNNGGSSSSSGGGLSRSDIIALGVGLGVGIPSIIIALATCLKTK